MDLFLTVYFCSPRYLPLRVTKHTQFWLIFIISLNGCQFDNRFVQSPVIFVLGHFYSTAPLSVNLGKLCQAILTILRKDYNQVELLLPCHLRLIASFLTHAFLTEVHMTRITFTRTNPKGIDWYRPIVNLQCYGLCYIALTSFLWAGYSYI